MGFALLLLPALILACGQPTVPTRAVVAVVSPSATAPGQLEQPTAYSSETPQPTSTVAAAPTATSLPTPSAAPTLTPTATPCPAGKVITGTLPSAFAGADHSYRLYTPPCYPDGFAYPTLYLFAGNIHDESTWDALGADEAANEIIVSDQAAPFIVVMPDGGWLANNTSGGSGSYESLVLDELIPYVEANHCAWSSSDGRAIGGLSRGGYWALEIAFRFPHLFDSVGGHSAALLDQFAGPTINPQFTYANEGVSNLRIYLDIGADDYLRANTIRLHNDMEASGINHDWHLNEGRHEDAYWAEHVKTYLKWYAAPWSSHRADYPTCNP